jgi:hypothetical protein
MQDSFDIYWTVNQQRTYSKAQALLWAQGNVSQVQWHWMENTWDRVNFSQESINSWDELCTQRARQIRDSHSWVCLWFSGGYDSAHILDVFVRAGLPIDEFAIFDQTSYYDDGEKTSALTIAQEYQKYHNPRVKISVADLGWDFIKNQFNQDWLLSPGGDVRITRTHWAARKDLISVASNRVDVTGYEKPRLSIHNGQWQTFMVDSMLGFTAGSGIEQFYCSHSMPDLHVKQIHMAINYFEKLGITDHNLVHRFQSFGQNTGANYRDWNLALGRVLPRNPASQHGTQKLSVGSSVLVNKDQNILKFVRDSNNTTFHKFQQGLNILKETVIGFDPWSEDSAKLPDFCSKFYSIKPVTVRARPEFPNTL